MTRDQTQLVEESFTALGPVTIEMGEAFYENLFEIAPELRPMFPRSVAEQAMRFSEVLAHIISNLRAPDRLLPIVHKLGVRHRDLGVVAEHFPPFKEALLKTLQERMLERWTAQTETAWSATFDLLAAEMTRT